VRHRLGIDEVLNHSIGRSQPADWIGNPVMPGFMLASLLWVKEEEPETWRRLAHALLAKDYARLRLTGELAAHVFGVPVRTTQTLEAAALLAGADAGVFEDMAQACARVRTLRDMERGRVKR
jgi:sugar (pentulose or hexulose) kinase